MNSSLLTLKVARKTDEAIDIRSFVLVDPAGGSLPGFSAGSHIDVHGPTGLVRQYSLCNAPNPEAHSHYQISVLRDPNSRGGSVAMHDDIQEGDLVKVSEPRNHFPLEHAAKRSLLLAGGIGVTPILCMAESLSNLGAQFEMHYWTRSRQRAAFSDRIARSAFSSRVSFHFDDGPDEQKLDIASLLRSPDHETHLYVCGPTGYLEHVLSTARTHGWREPFIHYEYFGAAVGRAEEEKAFDIKINSTGEVYRIPADKSVAVALGERGIDIPVSCEQGVCGTCVTRVLNGEPDHRDHYFTDAEHARNDQFTPCCSRAKGEMLVLDL